MSLQRNRGGGGEKDKEVMIMTKMEDESGRLHKNEYCL